MNSIRASSFLRRVLLVDAVSCGAMGLGLIAFTDFVARVLELPAQLLSEAGIVLLPFAAFLAYVASRPTPTRFAVWAIIVLNVIWVVDSIVLLFTGWVAPNALGYAFVIAQAVVVAVLADLEYVGLKKSAYAPSPKTS
jgi:hypothetical protein